jgi:hypothetical protein
MDEWIEGGGIDGERKGDGLKVREWLRGCREGCTEG